MDKEEYFKNKYLLYKKKYLELVYQIGGEFYLEIDSNPILEKIPESKNYIVINIDRLIKNDFIKFIEEKNIFPIKNLYWDKRNNNKLILIFNDDQDLKIAKEIIENCILEFNQKNKPMELLSLPLPDDWPVIYITDINDINNLFLTVNSNIHFWTEKGKTYLYGFDIEKECDRGKVKKYRGRIKNNIALVQFALPLDLEYNKGYIILLHISKMKLLNNKIKLTSHKQFLKFLKNAVATGVEINNDIRGLISILDIPISILDIPTDTKLKLCKYMEINEIIKLDDSFPPRKDTIGLREITRKITNHDLTKRHEITCSDWTNNLLPEQINYAALDAYASLLCGKHFYDKFYEKKEMDGIIKYGWI